MAEFEAALRGRDPGRRRDRGAHKLRSDSYLRVLGGGIDDRRVRAPAARMVREVGR